MLTLEYNGLLDSCHAYNIAVISKSIVERRWAYRTLASAMIPAVAALD